MKREEDGIQSDYEEPIQHWYEEDDVDEEGTWHYEDCSKSDFEDEPYYEELEPEPPESYHTNKGYTLNHGLN
ncbi:unnamed protein product [Arabis nemorensis]|uniref:Uncharacterized protein n=1 Tax=Arabis nemorensis TaxID=586526 RepID=A0A565BVW6_9BRAS|nr:unnamed protein product [Arabis nemorensis]